MEETVLIKRNLLLYLTQLEEKNKGVSNTYFKAFYNGEIKGIKAALSFIDGDIYYKDGQLYNRRR